MKNKMITKVSSTCHKLGFVLKKNSPEILVIAGVVGVVASAVVACVETRKLDDILDDTKNNINDIKETADVPAEVEKSTKKELAKVYCKSGLKIARLYAPSILLGTVSVTSILAGYNILKKRDLALAAAYATIDQGFSEYRKNVVERFGEEVDKELKYGMKKQKIEETVTDENGKEKKVKKDVMVSNLSEYSDYALYFDEKSHFFQNNDDYDLMFLNGVEHNMNDVLRFNKSLTLREVLDRIGFDDIPPAMKKAALVVGWLFEEDNQEGDNKVKFNAQKVYRTRENGIVESAILLDFNVDGNIYNRIDKNELAK